MNTRLEEIRKLYAELPSVQCKGLCWNSCGPIDMSEAEREQIESHGPKIPEFTQERAERWSRNEPLHCPALKFGAGPDGAIGCSVYEDRPLICRIWGVGEDDLACPHGCETTGRLNHGEVGSLLARSFRIGGHPDMQISEEEEAWAIELMGDPEIEPLFKRFMQNDRSVLPELQRLITARRQEHG